MISGLDTDLAGHTDLLILNSMVMKEELTVLDLLDVRMLIEVKKENPLDISTPSHQSGRCWIYLYYTLL